MTWTIAFDSGCDLRDLPVNGAAELVLVPLKIRLGDSEVVDDGSTSMEELQERLDSEKVKTGTACPSVGDWHEVMERGENVLAITISGAVSGSYQSALAARHLVHDEDPHKNVFVMDSVSGSGTMQALVETALRLIEAGKSFEEVCQGVQDCRSRSEIFFLLQNVDNIMSNGRLNPIIGRAVKALKLCLLATVSEEGKLGVIAKVRGFRKTMDKAIKEAMDRGCHPRRIIITHCLNPDGAEVMKTKLLEQFPLAEVEVLPTGLLCGYYAENGGLIVALES